MREKTHNGGSFNEIELEVNTMAVLRCEGIEQAVVRLLMCEGDKVTGSFSSTSDLIAK